MWGKYELCKVIKILPNQVVIQLFKNEQCITVNSKISTSEGSILVYEISTSKLFKYDKTFKPLYRDYTQHTKFRSIISGSQFVDSYMTMYEQGTSFKQIYEFIYSKNIDLLIINRMDKYFKKSIKVTFEINMPLYKHTLEEFFKNKFIYYLNKNMFYTYVKLNILNEKPYTKFFELYRDISLINFDTIKIC